MFHPLLKFFVAKLKLFRKLNNFLRLCVAFSSYWCSLGELKLIHCPKSVRIRSFSGPYFSALSISSYSVRIRENKDQKNSEYGHFSRSVFIWVELIFVSSTCLWGFNVYHLTFGDKRCVKSVRIRSFSDPYFPAFGLTTQRCRVSLL